MDDIVKNINEIINLHKNANYDQAQNKLNILLFNNVDNPDLYNLQGIIYRSQRDYHNSLNSFNNAILIDKKNPTYFNNRANVYRDLGNIEKAENDYKNALKIEPNYFDAIINKIKLKQEEGFYKETDELCKRAIEINKKRSEGYTLLGISLLNQKKYNSAIENFEKSQNIKFDIIVDHQLAILKRKEVESTPISYIEQTFDSFSKNFDEHLLNKLDYKLPALINKLINEKIEIKKFSSVIDLGCGTGLCGEFLKHITNDLVGIDISLKMLTKAKEKKVYNKLLKGDFINYLQKTNKKFDLFIASDVFIYTGAISKTFNLIKQKSKKESYFVFSVELFDGKKYEMLQTGRFAHSENYIDKKCRDNSFEIISCKKVKIRKENNNWINGNLYIVKI